MLQRAGSLLLVARVLAAQSAMIEGVVTNRVTHDPISGVAVRLTGVNAKDPSYETATDAAGGFHFAAVVPGAYRAGLEKDAFDADDTALDKPFDAVAGGTVSLRPEMIPLGTIHGRVIDGEGKPVAHIRVDWLTASPRRVHGSVSTDGDGRFTVQDVRPGSYVLRATPNRPAVQQQVVSLADLLKPAEDAAASRRPLYAPVYYPNSTDRALAAPVVLRGGEELTGFDIRMRSVAMYRIHGVVTNEKGMPAAGMSVKLRSADTWYWFNDVPPDALAVSAADGSFDFPWVAAGEWQITAERRHGPGSPFGYAAVTVTHHDLDSVQVRMMEPFALTGAVERIDGQGNTLGIKAARVQLVPVDRPMDQEAMGQSTDSGILSIHFIYPGRYRVVLRRREPGYYLASVRLGAMEVLGQEVELGPGSGPLRIVYQADGGSVRGTVEKGGNSTVVLLPGEAGLHDAAFIRSVTCDEGGHFAVDGLRPGSYFALALEDLDLDRLEDPIFVSRLVGRANGVRVERNEVAGIDLKLSPGPE